MIDFPGNNGDYVEGSAMDFSGMLPAWSEFIPVTPTAKQLAFLCLPTREALFGGAAGGGKVLYNESVILTPFGFKEGKDLQLGDLVNNPDGSISRITWLHPRSASWAILLGLGGAIYQSCASSITTELPPVTEWPSNR